MKVALFVEASQPSGKVYRIGIACELPPPLVSTIVLVLTRLF
jgi:hypothetical protein